MDGFAESFNTFSNSAQTQPGQLPTQPPSFYTMADFVLVQKIDAHVHIRTWILSLYTRQRWNKKAAEAEDFVHNAWMRDWQFSCTNDKMNSNS